MIFLRLYFSAMRGKEEASVSSSLFLHRRVRKKSEPLSFSWPQLLKKKERETI